MNELLWVKVPPPRVGRDSKLMLVFTLAIAFYAGAVVAIGPAPDTLELDYDDVTICCFCGHGPDLDPDDDPEADPPGGEYMMLPDGDQRLSREQAIKAARVGGLGHVGILGSSEQLRPNPYAPVWSEFDDGEFVYDPGAWRVRPFRQLSLAARRHTSQLASFRIVSDGTLDRSTIRRYINRHRISLARCYDPQPSLELGRALRGDADPTAQFLIDQRGRVVQVLPISPSPELAQCLQETLVVIKFPASSGLTQVVLPLHYGTTDASAGVFVR